MVADQALAALGVEAGAVEGDNSGRLLAAVLKRVQSEGDDRRRVGMAEDPEDAALFAQPVSVEVEVRSEIPLSPDSDDACRGRPGSLLRRDRRGAVGRRRALVD